MKGGHAGNFSLGPEQLGSEEFKRIHGTKYAYYAGAMYRAIASKDLVVSMANAGLMGFLGTGGVDLATTSESIDYIQANIQAGGSYGVNLLSKPDEPEAELEEARQFVAKSVPRVEASAFMQITPALAFYRLSGISQTAAGEVVSPRRILAKVSHPDLAEAFMRPVPDRIQKQLLASGYITQQEAEIGRRIPVANDICVEADSGGHTDQGIAYVLMPAVRERRAAVMAEHDYSEGIRVGAAGGIGTPDAIVAALMLGADFIVTGSVNQCTVEAGTSESVKDLLQDMGVKDTTYAPAGDMLEYGAQVQCLKKGVFFPFRAQQLYDLYTKHKSLKEIDSKTIEKIERNFFQRSVNEVWQETRDHIGRSSPKRLADLENNPRKRMAAIFKWYFALSTQLALTGDTNRKVDYQVHVGPALGAFNEWAPKHGLANWRDRYVADIGELLMQEAAELFVERVSSLAFGSEQ